MIVLRKMQKDCHKQRYRLELLLHDNHMMFFDNNRNKGIKLV